MHSCWTGIDISSSGACILYLTYMYQTVETALVMSHLKFILFGLFFSLEFSIELYLNIRLHMPSHCNADELVDIWLYTSQELLWLIPILFVVIIRHFFRKDCFSGSWNSLMLGFVSIVNAATISIGESLCWSWSQGDLCLKFSLLHYLDFVVFFTCSWCLIKWILLLN